MEYEVTKPDQSEIEIKRTFGIVIGKFIWDIDEHRYVLEGISNIKQEELVEILEAIKKLNKKTILPKWLNWKKVR